MKQRRQKLIEGVPERGAEKNARSQEGARKRRLEKTA